VEKDLTEHPDGATRLTPEDLEGLLPAHISTRGELDEWEAQNILKARTWVNAGRHRVLDDKFVRDLHKKMFDETWEWAGQYRNDERNIGIDPRNVSTAVRNLCENTKARLATGEEAEKVAVWFHHQLTRIHPFRNGNGRHARLTTDQLLVSLGQQPFTWGLGDLIYAGETRKRYIAALREADKGDPRPLAEFVRSGGRR